MANPGGRLPLHPLDDPAHAYVLAVPFGSAGRSWRLAGWLWGEVIRQEKWWGEPPGEGGSWQAPQSALLPMSLYLGMVPHSGRLGP